MRYKILAITILLFISSQLPAQKLWTLLECVQYARDSNVTVRKAKIQEMLSAVDYKQRQMSRLPTANYSNNLGYSFGRSNNPATGILESQTFLTFGLNFQTSVDIFNFYSKRNSILASQWSYEAAKATTEKTRNDISLTVANGYLQVLLAREQEKISEVQLQQSQAQLYNVQKLVDAGSLPELNAAELEAQVATDSANLITARGNIEQAYLVLKSYMNMEADQQIQIDTPSADQIPLESIADLQPAAVYALALKNLPQQRANDYNLLSAQKNVLAARGAMYPSLSLFGNLGSNFVYFRTPIYQQTISGYSPSGLVVQNGTDFIPVQQPVFKQGERTGYFKSNAFGQQISDNFGQGIGINISVPLFNGYTSRSIWARAKLDVSAAELQKIQDNQTIKQDIYQAYNSAIVALEKFNASAKSVEAAQRSYDFSLKRFDIGVLGTYELTTNQNNLLRAKLQYVLNQFDYVFKMKVLEFYKGQGLKL